MTTSDTPSGMRPNDLMRRSGAVWCDREDHHRWECRHNSKRSGERCHGPAITGTDACRMHPGTTSAVAKARGEARMAAWSLEAAGEQPAPDLEGQMLALITMTTYRLEVYSQRLLLQFEEGEDSGLVGVTYAAGRDGGPVATGEQLRGLAKLEGDERDRLARYIKSAHDMGIAERVVELQQSTARRLFEAYVASFEVVPELLPAQRDSMLRAFLAGIGVEVGHTGPDGSGVGVLEAGGS
jgi:hypothetical protein